MVDKVMKLLMLFSPISYCVGMSMEKFDVLLFRLGVGALVIASMFDIRQSRSANRLLSIRILGSFLLLALWNVLANSLNLIIFAAFLDLLLGIIAILIVVDYARNLKDFDSIITIAVCLNMIVFFAQKLGWSPIISVPFPGKEGGLMGNAPRLVDFLTITTPFMPWPLVIISAIIAILTKELMLLPVLAIILILKYRNIIRILSFGLIPLTLILFHNEILNSIMMRWTIWRPTIEVLAKQPLKGYGLGIFPHISPQFIAPGGYLVDYTFNSYLNIIFGLGVLVLIPIGIMIYRFFRNFRHTQIHYSILSLILLSMVEYPFEIPRLWLTLAILIGIYFKKIGGEDVS